MSLKWAFNTNDFRAKAKKRLPKMVFDFLDGGAIDEDTLRASTADFRAIELAPTGIADPRGLDPRTTVLGVDVSFPLLISPMGILTMFHPQGDLALAAEAERMGTIFMHSGVSGVSIEDTARMISPERLWAQMYDRTEAENDAYLARLRHLGITTLILNADPSSSDRRERDLRNGLGSMPPRPPLRGVLNVAMHPGWVYRWLTGPKFNFADYLLDGRPMKMREMYPYMKFDPYLIGEGGWGGIKRIREKWEGNLVIKGLSSPGDALLAAGAGADAIHISNMGARHFGGTPSTISSLPAIVGALREAGSKMEVIIDGGVRRGHDVVRALALGATAVSAGRPFAYALGAYGRPGVARAYDLLKSEFEGAMLGVGRSTVESIDESVIAYMPVNERYPHFSPGSTTERSR